MIKKYREIKASEVDMHDDCLVRMDDEWSVRFGVLKELAFVHLGKPKEEPKKKSLFREVENIYMKGFPDDLCYPLESALRLICEEIDKLKEKL